MIAFQLQSSGGLHMPRERRVSCPMRAAGFMPAGVRSGLNPESNPFDNCKVPSGRRDTPYSYHLAPTYELPKKD